MCEVAEALSVSQATLYRHLAAVRNAKDRALLTRADAARVSTTRA